MALLTLGTNATSSLSALMFTRNMVAADLASLNALIKSTSAAGTREYSALSTSGQLFIPAGGGVVTVQPGDYVAVDSTTGWPIVISAKAIASGPYTHS